MIGLGYNSEIALIQSFLSRLSLLMLYTTQTTQPHILDDNDRYVFYSVSVTSVEAVTELEAGTSSHSTVKVSASSRYLCGHDYGVII